MRHTTCKGRSPSSSSKVRSPYLPLLCELRYPSTTGPQCTDSVHCGPVVFGLVSILRLNLTLDIKRSFLYHHSPPLPFLNCISSPFLSDPCAPREHHAHSVGKLHSSPRHRLHNKCDGWSSIKPYHNPDTNGHTSLVRRR